VCRVVGQLAGHLQGKPLERLTFFLENRTRGSTLEAKQHGDPILQHLASFSKGQVSCG
jgi:hypothetical protein